MLYGLFVFNFHHYYYYKFLWIKHCTWNLSLFSVPPIRSHWTLSATWFHCGFSAESTPCGNVVNDYTIFSIYRQCFCMHWCSKFMHGVQWRVSNTTHSFPPCQGRLHPPDLRVKMAAGPCGLGKGGRWGQWVAFLRWQLGGGGGGGPERRMLKNEAGHIILNLAKAFFFSCTACILLQDYYMMNSRRHNRVTE